MSTYYDPMAVQERIETLRREAERERLVRQLTRSRREKDNSQNENRTERRAAGRVPGRWRILRWGAGA